MMRTLKNFLEGIDKESFGSLYSLTLESQEFPYRENNKKEWSLNFENRTDYLYT